MVRDQKYQKLVQLFSYLYGLLRTMESETGMMIIARIITPCVCFYLSLVFLEAFRWHGDD
jgi:hypothetical protein